MSVSFMKAFAPSWLALAALLAAPALPGLAQQPGPITPLPGKEVRRIPIAPGPGAPPIPAPEIIRQFTAREDEFSRAHSTARFACRNFPPMDPQAASSISNRTFSSLPTASGTKR